MRQEKVPYTEVTTQAWNAVSRGDETHYEVAFCSIEIDCYTIDRNDLIPSPGVNSLRTDKVRFGYAERERRFYTALDEA